MERILFVDAYERVRCSYLESMKPIKETPARGVYGVNGVVEGISGATFCTCPAMTGSFSGIYPAFKYRQDPKDIEVAWLETHEYKHALNKAASLTGPRWKHLRNSRDYRPHHVDIGVGGLASWDGAGLNIGNKCRFGHVKVEDVTSSIYPKTKSVCLLGLYHHTSAKKEHKDWLLSDEALESGSELFKRVREAFEPDYVFVIEDVHETEDRYGENAGEASRQLSSVVAGQRQTRVFDSSLPISQALQCEIELYADVMGTMNHGKVMVVSNSWASAALTKPPEFSFI